MRAIDFSSWQALLSTLLGLALITLIGVGFRLVAMQTIQQRRERENRQINERLRTLMAAYKTLGGSFTGNLAVDPQHRRDARRAAQTAPVSPSAEVAWPSTDRSRRTRDAVEAALSDILLLGTEEQVILAAQAASDLAAGRVIDTSELVVSLRDFIRNVLDLDPIPSHLAIPRQGPTRPGSAARKGEGRKESGGGIAGGKGSGVGGMGIGAGGMGTGVGVGVGLGTSHHEDGDADSLR
ncbi:hypothetical protein [Cupriavidus pauculus]|uniref:Uncharacterized protein n=1 Tax=Cupriavidus pauculus TaxID=82633 RepID=A0A2N5CDL4_9BURK|nr:hypothetical protein [Cupriavidus pauculus]PLQ00282.1 hypothetical protein CYJ10_11530 [Cupriavidus pauculus]